MCKNENKEWFASCSQAFDRSETKKLTAAAERLKALHGGGVIA
jgi:hypothetical protein